MQSSHELSLLNELSSLREATTQTTLVLAEISKRLEVALEQAKLYGLIPSTPEPVVPSELLPKYEAMRSSPFEPLVTVFIPAATSASHER